MHKFKTVESLAGSTTPTLAVKPVTTAVKKQVEIPPGLTKAASLPHENLVLFIGGLVIYTLAAYYITITLGLYFNDTVSRSALGFFVTSGRDPHLAAVGFLWTPLLSLLQIPFFPILKIWNEPVLGGIMITVVCGAATLPVLNSIGRNLGIHRFVRLPVIILYGLHPTILLYTAIGLSEVPFFFCLALISYALFEIVRFNNVKLAPVLLGVSLAGAFWIRYEAVPLMVGVAIAILLTVLIGNNSSWRAFRHKLEGFWATLLFPIVYSGIVWVFFNWLITGNPLFFVNGSGDYRNSGAGGSVQITNSNVTDEAYHNLPHAIEYGLGLVSYQFVFFVGLILFAFGVSLWKRSLLPAIPLLLPLSIFSFHVFLSYVGDSFGWYRFYTYALPVSVAIFFWVLSFLPKTRLWQSAVPFIMLVSLALSFYTTITAMSSPIIGREENNFVEAIRTGGTAPQPEYRTFAASREVADYISQHQAQIKGPILLDTTQGFAIVLFAKDPKQFIITQDRDFQKFLSDPVGKGVRWLIVPNLPATDPRLSGELILRQYPQLATNGVAWAKIAKDFGEWKLFEVTPPDQQ